MKMVKKKKNLFKYEKTLKIKKKIMYFIFLK